MAKLNERARDHSGFTLPAVSLDVFLGTIWTLTILSFIFLPARLYARWTATKRLFWDDFLVTCAWIISLAITVTITVYYPITIEIILIGSGRKKFPPNVKVITMEFTRVFTAIPMLFYAGLWCIKLAFLLFFKRLGLRNVTSLRRWWRVVLAVTILSFLLCYTTLPYRCTFVSFEVVASPECQTQGWSFISMAVNTALDVVTDCLIMSIPFLILRRIRITGHQKIALSAVFSLVIITMIFAIVRAVITTVDVERQIDPIWMYMWTNIELNVAVIVACIAPYRSLFIRGRVAPGDPRQPQNIQDRARKLWASSFTRSARRNKAEGNWSSTELPYLAPWVEEGNSEYAQPGSDTKRQAYGTMQVPSQRVDPSMTANLPYLAPWSEDEAAERARESRDVLLSSPPPAHLSGSPVPGDSGCFPSWHASKENTQSLV